MILEPGLYSHLHSLLSISPEPRTEDQWREDIIVVSGLAPLLIKSAKDTAQYFNADSIEKSFTFSKLLLMLV